MNITPLVEKDKKLIKSYGSNIFRISDGTIYNTNIFISPSEVMNWNLSSSSFVDGAFLSVLDFKFIDQIIKKFDIMIIGTGNHHLTINREIISKLQDKADAIEVMNSRYACSTYNVLLTEGRNVCAAIIKVV